MFKNSNITTRLLCLILLFIGFQQFPVLRIGGSLKFYEICAIIYLFLIILTLKTKIPKLNIVYYLLLFFIVSPILSYLVALMFVPFPYGFYNRYPGAISFKFNHYLFPLLQLLYMFFNGAVIIGIIRSTFIFQNLEKILKYSILIGTCISLYSLFSMFVYDFVLHLPTFIQNKTKYDFRSSGFSQEPSFYVLYQGWICLITYYCRKLFTVNYWRIILAINALSLILSFSTMIVALLFLILFSVFLFNTPLKTKLRTVFALGVMLVIGAFTITYLNRWELFNLLFITKIQSFVSAPLHTMDSGSFRTYTSGIGFRIFNDYPVTGVGVGNSIYYMYLYEFKMGIKLFGERLAAGSFPQNTFSSVLSEQGLFGGTFLTLILYYIIKQTWLHRNESDLNRMFFIGSGFNIITMLTVTPVYSLYLWVFMALAINYIHHINAQGTRPLFAVPDNLKSV